MRQFVFPKSIAASLGTIVLGGWLGPVGVVLAQPQYPVQVSCSPPYSQWEWSAKASDLATGSSEQPADTPSKNPETVPDPTSVLNPSWDNLPTEESWTISTTPDVEEPLLDASPSEGGEESSACPSETSPLTTPYMEEGEVESIQEYFQRYGSHSAGHEGDSQPHTYSETPSPSDQQNTTEMAEQEQSSLQEETAHPLETTDAESNSTLPQETEPSSQPSMNADTPQQTDANDEQADDWQEDTWETTEQIDTEKPRAEHSESLPESQEESLPPEREDVSADQPDGMDSAQEESMNPTSSEAQPESEYPQESENQQDIPQDPSEPSSSPEDQLLETPSEMQTPMAEPWSPWGYEPGYESVEAEYNPSEPRTSSESEDSMKSESSDDTPSSGNPALEEEHFTPPGEPLPENRYEYPEQEWKDWPETDPSSSQETDPSDQPPSTETSPEDETSYPMEQEETSSPMEEMEEKVTPEMNSPEDLRLETMESESSGSAVPDQESNPADQELGQSASSSYPWWLENPDTWTEESAGQTSTADDPKETSWASDVSSQADPEEEHLMGEEEAFEEETPSDEAMDRDVSIEEDPEAEDSLGSEVPGEENADSFHSSGEYGHVQPSFLEGLGQGLLRLVDPWKKTLSGLWESSTGSNWFPGGFPIGQEKTEQEGAATRPTEAVAR